MLVLALVAALQSGTGFVKSPAIEAIEARGAMVSQAGACAAIGYSTGDAAEAFAEQEAALAAASGIDPDVAREALKRGMERRNAELTELQSRFGPDTKIDASFAQRFRGYLTVQGRRCDEIAKDPRGALLVTPGQDGRTIIDTLADRMLEPAGLAAWQTPKILAAGDAMYVAGACEGVSPAPRLEAVRTAATRAAGGGDKPTAYLDRMLDLGSRSAGEFDAVQCGRLVTGRLADLAK